MSAAQNALVELKTRAQVFWANIAQQDSNWDTRPRVERERLRLRFVASLPRHLRDLERRAPQCVSVVTNPECTNEDWDMLRFVMHTRDKVERKAMSNNAARVSITSELVDRYAKTKPDS